MEIATVAVMAPGDMGHAIGRRLVEAGLTCVTNLAGRSDRSRALAAAAGIADLGSDAALLEASDLVLSIMPPDRALGFVERIADTARKGSRRPLLVDLNAVAPSTARRQAAIAAAAGLPFLDGAIIGGPPHPGKPSPRIYVAGPGAERLVGLAGDGLDIRALGERIGAASALKMCFATLTKGVQALAIEAFVAARLEAVSDALSAELAGAQPALLKGLAASLPGMPPKAYRWVGEMEEIARTFADVGLSAKTFEGAAEVYRFVEGTPLGREVVENRTIGTDLDDLVARLAAALAERSQPA